MSEETWERLIKFFLLIAGAGTVLWKWADVQKVKYKEKSVGSTKVNQIVEDLDAVKDRVTALEGKDGKKDIEISSIKSTLDRITQNIIDLFKLK